MNNTTQLSTGTTGLLSVASRVIMELESRFYDFELTTDYFYVVAYQKSGKSLKSLRLQGDYNSNIVRTIQQCLGESFYINSSGFAELQKTINYTDVNNELIFVKIEITLT